MSITFEELKRVEGAWVDVQMDLGLSKEQIAINLGYTLSDVVAQ